MSPACDTAPTEWAHFGEFYRIVRGTRYAVLLSGCLGAPGIAEVVADKGYHSNETMVGFAAIGVRSYVSEPDRGRRHWKGQAAARDAVYLRGARGKRLLRQRGELLERPNATRPAGCAASICAGIPTS